MTLHYEGSAEHCVPMSEADAARLEDILDNAWKLNSQDSRERVRQDAKARKDEYRRRQQDALKRSQELRAELQQLEDD